MMSQQKIYMCLALVAVCGTSSLPGARAWYWFEPAAPAAAPPSPAPAEHTPKAAQATFEMDGVKGYMRFTPQQHANSNKSMLIEYDLHNLRGNNQLYHVHVRPVPKFDPIDIKNKPGAIGDLCNEPATGGHLNPFNVKEKLAPKAAPFDRYELGDLAGKHGAFVHVSGSASAGDDSYKGSFVDPNLTLDGPNGIIGRSIVIHKSDGGKRWVCASIIELKH